MVFKECSIGGITFRDQMENLVCTEVVPSKFNERSVRKFLEVLALCHTVQASRKVTANKSKNPLDLIYSAASPDEKAIVEACRNYGVAFLGKRSKYCVYCYKSPYCTYLKAFIISLRDSLKLNIIIVSYLTLSHTLFGKSFCFYRRKGEAWYLLV